MGALGGALAAGQQPRVLHLASVKSVYGHTEGAAGATCPGLLRCTAGCLDSAWYMAARSLRQPATLHGWWVQAQAQGMQGMESDKHQLRRHTAILRRARAEHNGCPCCTALMQRAAAGLTGALMALSAARQQAAPPVAHLRNVNAYVQTSLDDWAKRGRLQGAVPRAAAPAVGLHTPGVTAGTLPCRHWAVYKGSHPGCASRGPCAGQGCPSCVHMRGPSRHC